MNGTLVGRTLWGAAVVGSLTELTAPVDVVDVFRRSEALPAHVDGIPRMKLLPKVAAVSVGVRNDAVARTLEGAGITVVQDRCMLADHRAM